MRFETAGDGGFATEYSDLDKEVIGLLYHPEMAVGPNKVKHVLKDILSNN